MVIRMEGCESRPQSYKIQSCLNVRSVAVKLEKCFSYQKVELAQQLVAVQVFDLLWIHILHLT
jgi:hypothetical protein